MELLVVGLRGFDSHMADHTLLFPLGHHLLCGLPIPLILHLLRNTAGALSPPLLILALELLAIALRADPNINGIPYASKCYKVNMFVDDALLTLTNPIVFLPNLQSLLTRLLSSLN